MLIIEYVISLCIGLVSIYPPMGCEIPILVNSFLWVYLVIIAGFFGCVFVFSKLNFSLKIACLYLFSTCFISTVPYISFNAYIVFMAALLFYYLCIEQCNFSSILKILQAVFWFEVIMVIAQMCGKDTLINFDRPEKVFLGTVMQYMRCGSLFAILSPFLVASSLWYIVPIVIVAIMSQSSSFALSIAAGMFVYFFLNMKKKIWILLPIILGVCYLFYDIGSFRTAFTCGRIPVWGQIIKSGLQHPWFGYGMGTFSTMFPISIGEVNPFQQAHNSFLQIWWEIGIFGLLITLSYGISLAWRLYKQKEYLLVAGLATIATNMFFSFPDRMVQTCLLIVCYLAFCERSLRHGNQQSCSCEPWSE